MAVVLTGTVVHLTMPSSVDFKSLEQDGLAVLRLQSTGDASGGNVLHTFRGQRNFLYVLRQVSVEMDEDGGVNANPDVEVRLDAQWIADRTGQAQGDWFTVLSMANVGVTGGTNRRVAGGQFQSSLIEVGGLLPLGQLNTVGVHDIMALNHRENILNNTYTSYALFDVYRSEAFSVPRILDRIKHGLVR